MGLWRGRNLVSVLAMIDLRRCSTKSQQQYFVSSIFVKDGEKGVLQLHRALVSQTSVYKVGEENSFLRNAFLSGHIFRVELDGRYFQGRLIRESGIEGTHYNIRFIFRDELEAEIIKQLLAKQGFESPWRRAYARIPLSYLSNDFEYPQNVVFPRLSGSGVGEVVNYSVHGLFFESICTAISLSEWVNQKMKIKIISNRGRILDPVDVKIARIYDEVVSSHKIIRGYGVKILGMEKKNQNHFNQMILDACKDLKRSN